MTLQRRHLTKKMLKEILKEFIKKVPRIFGNNILFGFICGSLASQYRKTYEDIDMFVCLKRKPTKIQKKEFKHWYIQIHKKYSLFSDKEFPGEVMTLAMLKKRLALAPKWKPKMKIASLSMYDSLTWTDMISGYQVAHIGPQQSELKKIKKEYGKYPEKWKQALIKKLPVIEKKTARKMIPSVFLKVFVTYDT